MAAAELGLVEFNEAFASQTLACLDRLGIDPERANLDGGALALGHAYGASGAVLVTRLLAQARRRPGRRGSWRWRMISIAGGMGTAALLGVQHGSAEPSGETRPFFAAATGHMGNVCIGSFHRRACHADCGLAQQRGDFGLLVCFGGIAGTAGIMCQVGVDDRLPPKGPPCPTPLFRSPCALQSAKTTSVPSART